LVRELLGNDVFYYFRVLLDCIVNFLKFLADFLRDFLWMSEVVFYFFKLILIPPLDLAIRLVPLPNLLLPLSLFLSLLLLPLPLFLL